MKTVGFSAFVVVSFAAMRVSGGNELSCPKNLQATVQSGAPIPAGWLARNSSLKHTLNGVRINLGDPQTATDAAIYDSRSTAQEAGEVEVETLTWNLSQLRDAFIVCSYFGTNVILTRSLAGFSQCKVVNAYRRGSGRVDVRSAVCT
jgi:hypothetical protein